MAGQDFGAEYLESQGAEALGGTYPSKYCIIDPYGSGSMWCYTAGRGWYLFE